jgi:GAF domain-containing protein
VSEPNREPARQRELDAYRIVDSLPEAAYQDIVHLASTVCEAPVALVSLLDRERQWFKARVGFELAQTDRDVAFCDHAIRDPERLMEIPDATRDARFRDNPLVTGEDGVRFYAGMPLVTPSGAAIGTVCVLDREPRQLNDTQREALAALARLTMNLLDARQRELSRERAAALADASATEAAVAPTGPQAPVRTVALVELQDFAGVVARRGERATERVLLEIEQCLEPALVPAAGDSLHRVTGSPEMILVLHGDDVPARMQALHERLARCSEQHAIQALCAAASAASPEDQLDDLFLRADAALSALKDAAQSTAH